MYVSVRMLLQELDTYAAVALEVQVLSHFRRVCGWMIWGPVCSVIVRSGVGKWIGYVEEV